MSDAKTGTFVAAPAIAVAGAGATVLAAGALLGAGALALGLVAKGMMRLAKEVQDQIEDQVEATVVKEQIERQKRLRDILNKGSFQMEGVRQVETENPDPEKAVATPGTPEASEFLQALETFQEDRADMERRKRLKNAVSNEMAEAIEEIKRRRSERAAALEQMGRESHDPDFGSFYAEIRARCESIRQAYPDEAEAIEDRLRSMKKDERNFRRVLSRLNGLIEKLAEKPFLYDLAKIYNDWKRSDTILLLGQAEDEEAQRILAGFDEVYRSERDRIELGMSGRDGLEKFEERTKEYLRKAERRQKEIIFHEDVGNVKKAMRARGFDDLKMEKAEGYMKITGKRREDPVKKARVSLKLPDNAEAGAVDCRMEVEGYEEYAQRKEQNMALIRELESLGLQMTLQQSVHDAKGNLVPEALENWFKERFPHLNVRVQSGNLVNINRHGIMICPPGDSDARRMSRVRERIGKSEPAEGERLQEQ